MIVLYDCCEKCVFTESASKTLICVSCIQQKLCVRNKNLIKKDQISLSGNCKASYYSLRQEVRLCVKRSLLIWEVLNLQTAPKEINCSLSGTGRENFNQHHEASTVFPFLIYEFVIQTNGLIHFLKWRGFFRRRNVQSH